MPEQSSLSLSPSLSPLSLPSLSPLPPATHTLKHNSAGAVERNMSISLPCRRPVLKKWLHSYLVLKRVTQKFKQLANTNKMMMQRKYYHCISYIVRKWELYVEFGTDY
jgi:hypothetical protein